MGLFKKDKENLIITIDILTKKKYDHTWQKEYLGNVLMSFYSDSFDNNAIMYFNEKNYFTGFEIVLEGSKFKLNKIEDINNWEQFVHRYEEFLPGFLQFMGRVLLDLKLKWKINRIQHLSSSLDDYVKAVAMAKASEMDKKGKNGPLNIHFLQRNKKK